MLLSTYVSTTNLICRFNPRMGAWIARWLCAGLTVLLDAAPWVPSSSEKNFFSGRGAFSLGVNMGSDDIPQKTLSHKPKSSLCTHAFHRTDSKDSDIHALDGWKQQQKQTQQAQSRRWNVTTSMVGLKRSTYAKISPKMVNPRDTAGEHRRRRRIFEWQHAHLSLQIHPWDTLFVLLGH